MADNTEISDTLKMMAMFAKGSLRRGESPDDAIDTLVHSFACLIDGVSCHGDEPWDVKTSETGRALTGDFMIHDQLA